MKIGIANPAEVDALWPIIASEMQRGCDKTGNATSAGDLWQMCRSGNAFLFVGIEGDAVQFAAVWRFETWPSGMAFRCLAVCGRSMRDWIAQHYEFAQEQASIGGASRIVAEGRPGWPRVLARYINRPVKPLWQTFEVL